MNQISEITAIKLIKNLSKVFNNEKTKQIWLKTTNNAFDNLTPLEVIAKGDYSQIQQMIHLLQSGEVF